MIAQIALGGSRLKMAISRLSLDRIAASSFPGQARLFAIISLFSIALGISNASAEDWPTWRGPGRNGHTMESSGWKEGAWPLAEPVWKANVGEGCTSPVVAKGRLYSLGWEKGKDTVVCLDAATGASLWKQSYETPRYGRHHTGDEDAYSGPTATPEFDTATGLLYTLGADGELACWDTAAGGRRAWGTNLYDVYSVPRRPEVGKVGSLRDYGYITAPLGHGDWLLVAVGAKEGHLMAFDKRSGKRVWASESAEPAGHCGGLSPIMVEGIPCVASFTLRKLVVIRLDAGHEGKTVAEHRWETDFGNNVASPAVHGNSVLITSAYNHHAMCRLDISLGVAKKIWEVPFASGACTPIIHKDRVYWAWERVRCLDFATGEQKWEGGTFGSPGSCILTADGKLVVWGQRGKLALLEPEDKYQELARADRVFDNYAWPHVVLADKRLYCKDRDGNLKCLELKGKP